VSGPFEKHRKIILGKTDRYVLKKSLSMLIDVSAEIRRLNFTLRWWTMNAHKMKKDHFYRMCVVCST